MKIINQLINFVRGAQNLRKHDSETPEAAPPPSDQVSDPMQTPGYAADQPIRTKEEDRFNRWPFAERIAQTLAARTDTSSLVVGLYGVWGDGKTSTLRLMEQALGAHPSQRLIKQT